MLNKVILIGRLTRDPELKYTPNSVAVCTFTLAVDRSFTNQQGEREADFLPICTWRGLAENCGKYLAKGRMVAVSGKIQTRNYDTPEGQKRYITEIIADEVQFLERSKQENQNSGSAPAAQPTNQGVVMPGYHETDEGEDDELPF